MTFSFNLISEPWLPCVLCDGGTAEYGLLEALLKAPEIRAIAHPYPPVTAALHRLLLAVLHRNFGPPTVEAWKRLRHAGRWDQKKLEDYFGRWYDRFNLFHPDRPFFQVPSLEHKGEVGPGGYELSPITKLVSASNPTLFNHTLDEDPPLLPPAECARLVVTYQAFFLGGLVSRTKGEPASAKSGPVAKGAVVLFEADNLFETLLCNLIIYNVETGEPFAWQSPEDCPAWERDPVAERTQRPPLGYLDYLTWQTMRLRLFPERDGGRVFVRRVIAAAGAQMDRAEVLEPQFAYRKNTGKGSRPGGEPWLPVRFLADRVLWRDSTALLATAGEALPLPDRSELSPKAVRLLSTLALDGAVPLSSRLRASLCGICSDQAKINFWRQEHMPVPVAYLREPDLVSYLGQAVRQSERAASALRFALQPGELARAADGQPEEEFGDGVVASALTSYWPRLEDPFLRLLEDLPNESEATERWLAEVRGAARAAFDYAVQGWGATARSLRLVTRARGRLEAVLSGLGKKSGEVGNVADRQDQVRRVPGTAPGH